MLFYTTIKCVLDEEPTNRLFIEIGPYSALEGPLKQIFKTYKSRNFYAPTLIRNEHSTKCPLNTARKLHLRNINVDFSAINPCGVVLIDLPIYPWHHETEYWSEVDSPNIGGYVDSLGTKF